MLYIYSFLWIHAVSLTNMLCQMFNNICYHQAGGVMLFWIEFISYYDRQTIRNILKMIIFLFVYIIIDKYLAGKLLTYVNIKDHMFLTACMPHLQYSCKHGFLKVEWFRFVLYFWRNLSDQSQVSAVSFYQIFFSFLPAPFDRWLDGLFSLISL